MRILRVGDPHVKVSNLSESDKLMQFVAQSAIDSKVDRIEILGDLFHNHAVIRVEVLTFWNDWLDRLSMICETVVLVGNHDQTGSYTSKDHALATFKHIPNPNLYIIDTPTTMGNFLYVPYIHHEADFLAALSDAKVLVCHQTFQGSKYDNGMYAPDGFDLDKINIPLVISGHIHMRQRFGKCIYPGTAKWDTLSDANEEKGLWLVEHDDDTGTILLDTYLDTKEIVTPIYSIEWKEGQDEPTIPAGRVTVELIGSSEWIKKNRDVLKGKCGIKAKITDKARPQSRMAVKDLTSFIENNFEVVTGHTREEIMNFLKENDLV